MLNPIAFAFFLLIIGAMAFVFHLGKNLIMTLISLELMLLAIGIFALISSFILDDQIGSIVTLLLLPIAGAESALALAVLVIFYGKRNNINIK